MKTRLLVAGLVAVALAAGYLVWQWGRSAAPPAESAAPAPMAPELPAAAEPTARFPLESQPVAELPALEASDRPFGAALAELLGAEALPAFIYPEDMIRRIVATVDNLPRSRVASRLMPVAPVAGEFLVAGGEERPVIAPANGARYGLYLDLAGRVEVKRLVDLYVRFYPLFQQAYQELGYPRGYFNDRLVEAIDDLLAAPEPDAPVRLVRPNVLYQFADPELEALSAGQKIMVRMGTANAARARGMLRELRGELVSRAQVSAGRATEE